MARALISSRERTNDKISMTKEIRNPKFQIRIGHCINAQTAGEVHRPGMTHASLPELHVFAHHSWQLRSFTDVSRTVLISSADIPRSSIACLSDISHCLIRSEYHIPPAAIPMPPTTATSTMTADVIPQTFCTVASARIRSTTAPRFPESDL